MQESLNVLGKEGVQEREGREKGGQCWQFENFINKIIVAPCFHKKLLFAASHF